MKNFHRLVCLSVVLFLSVFSLQSQTYLELGEEANDQASSNFSRAIASDDEIIVVGCELCGTSGEVFVYSNCEGTINKIATLTVSTGIPSGALFGRSVDILNDVIVVGNRFGSVYVYEKPTGGWADMTQTATLTSTSTNNRTGELVKVTDKYVLAMNDPTSTNKWLSIFEKSGANWSSMGETARINRPDGSGPQSLQFARGFDAIGDTILVASANNDNPGYLYFKPSNGWAASSPITVPNVVLTNGSSTNPSAFARAAEITKDHAYISIQSEPVRIYERPVGGWSNALTVDVDYVLSSSSAASSLYGFSMDVQSDSILVVGDPSTDEGYVNVFYKGTNGSWSTKTEDQKIVASNGITGDRFGIGVSLNGKKALVVGADDTERNAQTDAGSFYSFENDQIDIPITYPESITDFISITRDGELVGFEEDGTTRLINDISEAGFSARSVLLEGSDKLLYGVSSAGGSSGLGFIYRINPDGRGFELLHEFDGTLNGQSGSFPSEALIEVNGQLIGGTFGDNGSNDLSNGTIFAMNLDGTGFNTIYTVNSGKGIRALFAASNGSIYSAINSVSTEIFRINADGTGFTSIATPATSFAGVTNFVGSLAEYNGVLYGLSNGGGMQGDGYLFSIDLITDNFSILYSLNGASDGNLTSSGLIENNGKLFGNTLLGGSNNDGTVFSYNISNNTYQVLYDYSLSSFDKSSLTKLSDGNAYALSRTGGVNGDGLLIQLDLFSACNDVIDLVSFESSVAAGPVGTLVEVINTPPLVLTQIPDQTLSEDQSSFSFDLNGYFDASDEPISNLDLLISSNSNPALFSNASISNAEDITAASLVLNPVSNLFGSADLTITVRDARGGEATSSFTVTVSPVADTPSITNAVTSYGQVSTSGLVITKNPNDGAEVTHYQITNIEFGAPMLSDNTEIMEGDFITISEGSAGLQWMPFEAREGSFDIQASTSADGSGVGGGQASATITVSTASLTITADDQSREYGQTNPTLTFNYSGFVNGEDESVLDVLPVVETAAVAGSGVGVYDIQPSGAGDQNYDFTYVDGVFTITQADLTIEVNDKTSTYGDNFPVFDGTFSGVVNNDDIQVIYSSDADPEVGMYDITATVLDPNGRLPNYTVSNTSGTLTISKASLLLTANDQTIAFGEALPTFDGTLAGVVNGDNITASYSTTALSGSDVGNYPITTSLIDPDIRLGNYDVVLTDGILTIIRASQLITFPEVADFDLASTNTVTLSATADSGLPISYVLDQGDGTLSGAVLTANSTGNFMVRATQIGGTNYNAAMDVSRSFTVTDSRKADQTITFEGIDAQEYGNSLSLGATTSSSLPITYTLNSGAGTISSGMLTIEGIGSYEITASQDGNDAFNPAAEVTQQFMVVQAPLTASADNQTIREGEAIPTLTISYAGFRLSDTPSEIDMSPSASTMATSQSEAGTYPIILNGGMDDVYSINLVDGTLTIEPVLGTGTSEIIEVYPNPASNRLKINGADYEFVTLSDLSGKVVLTANKTVQNELQLDALKQGVYVISLYRQGKIIHQQKLKIN